MAEQRRVMISGTARDLPEHRKKIEEACTRLGMFFPDMMEHLTATDANALEVSLRIVDRAEIYVGVFAFRYGYVPDGQAISVTESEYNRAVEREIPRLIFLMSDDHDIKPGDVETGEGAEKLMALKGRLKKERVVGFFSSADDLKAQVIQALVPYRESNVAEFHYIANIPPAPEVYIAHQYTLLQTPTLIGRQRELKLLTDWITGKELEFDRAKAPADSVRIMSVVAIGGMGKSALTWKWFNDVAPQEMKNLAGRMWWSFYESDATFENFFIRALAYVSKRSIDEVMKIPAPERESQLLAALDHQPFLLVLDGLERILIAYARMDAARLDDSEVGREKNLRKTADPRVGRFLQKLAQVKQSRILVSSRLYPAELETFGGDPIPGSFRIKIKGLTDEDAVELWRAFDVSGSHDDVVPVFNTFAKHPLLIQVLAGDVKRYRKAPGDFAKWHEANPKFDPSKFAELKDAMVHVLEFALRGLDEKAQKVLQTIAAFRTPTSYDTVTAVLVGDNKVCASEPDLDAVLNELEDRGLVGWDKRANRYDLHPIVRGVVWSQLSPDKQRGLYVSLNAHFETLPVINDLGTVKSLRDLTPILELYNTLIGLMRYDDAFNLFSNRLYRSAMYRLSANRECAELLEMLFSHPDKSSLLSAPDKKAASLALLALAYDWSGLPGRANPLYRLANTINGQIGNSLDICANKGNMASAAQLSGRLRESEGLAREAIGESHHLVMPFLQASSLFWLGLVLSIRGNSREAGVALHRSLEITDAGGIKAQKATAQLFIAQHLISIGDLDRARIIAEFSSNTAATLPYKRLRARAARRYGTIALQLVDFITADEKLNFALVEARAVNFVEEELPALVALSEMMRRLGNLASARGLLEDVWEAAKRGPYPLFHADALNVLAQIERDQGNNEAAIEAATEAYCLAWCDGPPFAYHWGLEKAQQHLKELGAPEPEMPPFDESKV